MSEPILVCPHCGEACDSTVTVDYDAMVDGPGYIESEERCARCLEDYAERCAEASDDAYYGGDSPGFYGPDDPGLHGADR